MEKIYCGNGKEYQFQNGSVINIMLDLDKLNAEFNNHGFTSNQGNKKIKVKVSARQAPDTYGNTHSVIIDTWKPNTPNNNNNAPQGQYSQNNGNFDDDSIGGEPIPF